MKPSEVREIVEAVFERDLSKRCRKRYHVNARHCYFYLAHTYCACSLERIGKEIGYDHATVLYGIRYYTIKRDYDGYKHLHERALRRVKRAKQRFYTGPDIVQELEYYKRQCYNLRRQTNILRRKLYDTGRISETV